LSAFAGIPLDGPAEAVVIGLVVPALWWAHRRFLDGVGARLPIAALLIVKCAGAVLLTQPGFCARFAMDAPLHTEVLTIPIDEPAGLLRSWDLRAGWRRAVPACTAIIDRPYATLSAFPAWFLNITDFESRGRRAITLDVSGVVRVNEPGRFGLVLDRDMVVSGHVGEHQITGQRSNVSLPLEAGTHALQLRARLTGDRWRLMPLWNDRLGLGFPLYAEGQIGAFYPPNVAFVLPSPVTKVTALALAAALFASAWFGFCFINRLLGISTARSITKPQNSEN
jgi:hypothetical protein